MKNDALRILYVLALFDLVDRPELPKPKQNIEFRGLSESIGEYVRREPSNFRIWPYMKILI